jgi:hypothetical protein
MRIPIRLPTREDLLARAFKHFAVQASDTSGPAIAAAAPLLPLLLTVFSPEELIIRIIKIVL